MKQKILLIVVVLCPFLSLYAQNRRITGTVTGSEDKIPLPGVNVRIKGTKQIAQTGKDGKYQIEAPLGAVLDFIYVGYQSQSKTVAEPTNIDVALVSDNKSLNEVVVTALGITKSSRSTGYATAKVSGEEINRAAPINLASGLQGKIAGVDVSMTSGQPGGSSKVIVRGFASISGNNQPLFVVDGVPVNNTRPGAASPLNSAGDLEENYDFGNAMNDINPNDMESVTVLKGAAASSLYGSRASNGVILITTKKGKAGAFKTEFSSSAAITNISIVPELQGLFGQGFQRQNYIAENGSWGAKFDGQIREWGSEVDGERQKKPFSALKNSFRDAYDSGAEYNNTIAFSGGNERATFRFSYGNVTSDGILPGANDTYKRNSLSLNGSTVYKGLSLSAALNYIGKNTRAVQTGQANAGVGSSFYEDILQIPVEFPIKNFEDYKNKFYDVDGFYSPFTQNPYYSVFENGSRFKSNRVYGNVDLKLKATDWLSFQFQQGIDINNITDKIWNAKNAPTPGSWSGGGNDEGIVRQESVGNVIEGSEKYDEYDAKLNGLFNKQIGADFELNGLVGLNFNSRGTRALYASVEGLSIPGFYQLDNSGNFPTTTEITTERRLLGLYGSATVGYRNLAFFTLNARNDWSSTLPVVNRSYFYPGANFSFILSQVTDLSAAKISLLKLRAAYGKTGSDTDPYSLLNTLSKTKVPLSYGYIQFPVDGVAGYTLSNTLRNENLRPEISTETEVGGEIQFFGGRLGLDFSYYNRVTNDQILPIVSAPSTGVNFRIVNFGKVRNRGVELAVNAEPLKTDALNWNLTYTFTRNRNKVLELPDGLNKLSLYSVYDAQFVAKVGAPLGQFEAPVPVYDPEGHIVVSGNGFALVAPNNAVYGDAQRDFIMGLSNRISYKNLTLAFTLDYKKGGLFYSGTADLLNFVGNSVNTLYNDRRPFIIPNSVSRIIDADGKVTGYRENTKAITEDIFFAYYYSDLGKALSYKDRILDKTYLKIRDVTLTYSLPQSLSRKIKADQAKITIYGRNLYTWLPKRNTYIDPEVSNIGNDLLSEFGEFRTGPSTRSFGLSLNLTF